MTSDLTTSWVNQTLKKEDTPLMNSSFVWSKKIHFNQYLWGRKIGLQYRSFELGKDSSSIQIVFLTPPLIWVISSPGAYVRTQTMETFALCSCCSTNFIPSLALESTSSGFQHILKTSWHIQLMDWAITGFLDCQFIASHCWISWTSCCLCACVSVCVCV